MFEGAFLIKYYQLNSNVCAAIRWKLENISGSEYLDPYCNEYDVGMSGTFLPVSLIGLLLSLFSACIFLGQRQRTSFRTSLVALSLATSGYMLLASIDFINVLSGACLYWRDPRRRPQVLVAAVACVLCDCLLCLRNWCNLLMTAQRTEALIFPLRVNKLLNKRNFVATLILLIFLLLPMSLVRSFAEFLVVCSDSQNSFASVGYPLQRDDKADIVDLESHYSYLYTQEWFEFYEAHVFFTVQTIIPVTCVMAFSVAMSVTMLKNRGGGGGGGDGGAASAVPSQSKRNKARASRTVLCLAIIFSALQMPSYLGQLLMTSGWLNFLFQDKKFQFVAELSLFLDSIFNIFVYAYFVPDFKLFFVRAWRRLTCQQLPESRRLPPGCSSDYSRRVQDSVPETRALRATGRTD